jgi:LytS/YehU family sensor histidine kinase
MLKEANSDLVSFKNEVEHIENYLNLEKLRLKNERFLNYAVNGDYQAIKIAPMIMIPFVENAFKHAVDSIIENGIVIKISVENDMLNFSCQNDYDISETDKDKVSGIGLKTVKKRLDLIYGNRYKLYLNSDNSVFKINLEIDLNDN